MSGTSPVDSLGSLPDMPLRRHPRPPRSFSDGAIGVGAASAGRGHGVAKMSALPYRRGQGQLSDATLRLFESTWFNMAMAISYLWKYRADDEVQQYICERMKLFDSRTIEFWLPQIIAIYVNLPTQSALEMPLIDTPLAHFIVERSSRYIRFATVTCWWLEAMCEDEGDSSDAQDLMRHIEQSRPQFPLPIEGGLELPPASPLVSPAPSASAARNKHRRTRSNGGANVLAGLGHGDLPPHRREIGELSGLKRAAFSTEDLLLDSGHAFVWPRLSRSRSVHVGLANLTDLHERPHPLPDDDVAATLSQCTRAQRNFIGALLNIASKLVQYESKEVRRIQLFAELALLNLNLPARVYLPLCDTLGDGSRGVLSPAGHSPKPKDHHVVRFPPQEAALLNSRDRVPYLVYVEVLDCENSQTAPLPDKLTLISQAAEVESAPSADETPSATGAAEGPPFDSARGCPKTPDNLDIEVGTTPIGVTADQLAVEIASLVLAAAAEGTPTKAAADSGEAVKQGFVSVADIRRNLVRAVRAPSYDDAKDPSALAFKEPWLDKLERIRRSSPYGHLPNWHLVPVIIKSGDDLRQELLGSQLMSAFRGAWVTEKVAPWIRPLQILVASHDGGLIEVVGSAVSIHQIKRTADTLLDYFLTEFGPVTSERFLVAQRNFAQSLAGYSLFCYFAQVKDRHNSNILIDGDGHILHIDLGFMLSPSNSPGGGFNFERAPFKLTSEYLQVLGGEDSDMLQYFRILVLQGFIAARKHMESIASVIEVMIQGSELPCLKDACVFDDFKERFQMVLTEERLVEHVDALMTASLDSARTVLYDRFQYYSNGIRE
eukprot:m.278604 g.278604  ORF g.278604 m.278604 type:complete len:831 (+) comp26952_c0_seq1:557-3049(+)